jgi:predicted nucleic acid-binding protein
MAEQAVGREREAGMVVADAGPLIHLSELDCLGLLADFSEVRLAAKTLAVEAHGTIGLLVRGIRRRQMSKEHVLALLSQIPKRSTLHIRPALLAEIIRQVAEAPTAR